MKFFYSYKNYILIVLFKNRLLISYMTIPPSFFLGGGEAEFTPE